MRRYFSGVALAAILLFQAFEAKAAAIRLSPSDASVKVGSSFTLDVVAEDINLGAYTLFVDYPAALVSTAALNAIEFGDFLGAPGVLSITDGADLFGQVRLDQTSFADEPVLLDLQGTAPGNSFVLATLTFDANAAGTAVFSLPQALLTLNGVDLLTADMIGASVEITDTTAPIPEPSTWAAAAIGMAALWIRKRQS